MLSVEDWAEIRRLHVAERVPIKQIARELGISKNTVKAMLAADAPPKYRRAATGSVVDQVEPRIRQLLMDTPTMPATVIAERIGWTRSITVLKDRVRMLRPLFVAPDPAQRTEYQPGELAQCDLWFPPAAVPLGFGQSDSPPVLVMVAGYSRLLSAVMIPSRQIPDLLVGQWTIISRLGVVPKTLVWDNESGIGQWRGGKPQLTTAMNAFRGTLGIRVLQCRPAERASLIVTSNKPFGRWGEVFGDDVVAAAMIDRLVHHAEVISMKGDSYRLKDRDLGRPPAATND